MVRLDGNRGSGLGPLQVLQTSLITSLPRMAPRDDQEARIRWKESEDWGEPLCEPLRLREWGALLIIYQCYRNATISDPQKELFPQVRASATMWDRIQRTSSLRERRYFHFMIKHKLSRPTAGAEVEIDGQQPIEDGFWPVRASGPSVCRTEPSR